MNNSIKVKVYYNDKLSDITQKDFESVILNEGSLLMYLLKNIFIAHPQIEKTFPAGKLGFKINGKPSILNILLLDGDGVEIDGF